MTWQSEPLAVSPARAAALQEEWARIAAAWWESATVEERELWQLTFGRQVSPAAAEGSATAPSGGGAVAVEVPRAACQFQTRGGECGQGGMFTVDIGTAAPATLCTVHADYLANIGFKNLVRLNPIPTTTDPA